MNLSIFKYSRKLHYLVVHPGVPPFSCSVCGKGYNNKSALYTHRTQSHSVNVITYTCNFCKKIFNVSFKFLR